MDTDLDVDHSLGMGLPMPSRRHRDDGEAAARRSRRTEIERISRRRRQAALHAMRDEVRRLELRVAVLTASHAAPESRSRGLAPSTRAVNPELGVDGAEYARLLREALIELKLREDELKGERRSLHESLQDKALLVLSLRSLTTSALRRWLRSEEKAEALLACMAPPEALATDKYYHLMAKTIAKTMKYDVLLKSDAPGLSCLGWTSRRYQNPNGCVFSLEKRFENGDVTRMVNRTWDIFTDQELLRQSFATSETSVQLRVVHKISDDVVVLHRMSSQQHCRYSMLHVVYVLFRVQTPEGVMLGMRSVRDHAKPLDQHPHRWTGILTWIHLRQLDPGSKACEVVYNNYSPNKHRHCSKNKAIAPGSCLQPWPLCGKQPGRRFSPEDDFISFVSTAVRWEAACVAPQLLMSSG